MKASYHVAVSAGVALGFQGIVQSWPATAVCFLSGVLIDLDHHLEYWIIKKKIPFRYKDLWDFCCYNKYPKLFLFFHGYEYLVLLWLIITVYQLGPLYLGAAVGVTVHVFFDQFTNPVKPLFYFLCYRIHHRFEKSHTVTEEYFKINRSKDESS